jgi:hypothetical protein
MRNFYVSKKQNGKLKSKFYKSIGILGEEEKNIISHCLEQHLDFCKLTVLCVP